MVRKEHYYPTTKGSPTFRLRPGTTHSQACPAEGRFILKLNHSEQNSIITHESTVMAHPTGHLLATCTVDLIPLPIHLAATATI